MRSSQPGFPGFQRSDVVSIGLSPPISITVIWQRGRLLSRTKCFVFVGVKSRLGGL